MFSPRNLRYVQGEDKKRQIDMKNTKILNKTRVFIENPTLQSLKLNKTSNFAEFIPKKKKFARNIPKNLDLDHQNQNFDKIRLSKTKERITALWVETITT